MNVELQTCARMIARQVNLAAGNKKTAMDELDHAVSEIAWKIRAVVSGAVLAQPARDKHFWKAIRECELHVWVSFVVAQQDVETRLALLDQVVFKCQGFM